SGVPSRRASRGSRSSCLTASARSPLRLMASTVFFRRGATNAVMNEINARTTSNSSNEKPPSGALVAGPLLSLRQEAHIGVVAFATGLAVGSKGIDGERHPVATRDGVLVRVAPRVGRNPFIQVGTTP